MTGLAGEGDGPVLISACLIGVACTHGAVAKTRDWALALVADGRAVPVCPEVAGGLPIPRPAAEIDGGDGRAVLTGDARVTDEHGVDVTDAYLRGAAVARAAAERSGAMLAILKARSPSCGVSATYDGSFTGRLADGDGVTTAMLRGAGIRVLDDETVTRRTEAGQAVHDVEP